MDLLLRDVEWLRSHTDLLFGEIRVGKEPYGLVTWGL